MRARAGGRDPGAGCQSAGPRRHRFCRWLGRDRKAAARAHRRNGEVESMKHKTNGTGIPQKVLVISDQSGFSRDLIARWQMQPHLPEFTALSSELWQGAVSSPFDVAVAGDIRQERVPEVLKQLNGGAAPSIY